MWQRIQTVFMLLAGVTAFLAAFALLSSTATNGDTGTTGYDLLIWGLGLGGGMVLANVFNFKKRKAQLLLNKWVMALVLAATAYLIYLSAEGIINWMPVALALTSMVLLALANRRIRADEEKVRAADRLR